MMPNISFFIPAYNCSSTIVEAVYSILTDNFSEADELIIVDDCSTDDTGSVLAMLKKKYPFIQIFTHKRNKGGAAARNTGVENAKNELLFCLDADNVLASGSITPLKEYLLEKEAEIACFESLFYFNSDKTIINEVWTFKTGPYTITDLLSGELSPGSSGNYLFSKSSWMKVGGYSEDLGALDTWSFGFKQLMQNCKMVVMPGGHYFHRRGHDSYYMRDAWVRRQSVSLRLIKLMIDYIDYIDPADVNYIFSKKGRYVWFDHLKSRPIKINRNGHKAPIWTEHNIENNLTSKLWYYKNQLQEKIKRKTI